MAFCGKCGSQIEPGKAFCTACGAPAGDSQQQDYQQGYRQKEYQQQGHQQQGYQQGYQQQGGYTPPVMPGAQSRRDNRDAEDNKAMAILAYIIFLIPLFAAKDSRFARFHTNQGLVLFILSAALGILYGILTSILMAISIRVGLVVSGILWILFLIPTILSIIGIIHACKGEMKPLPIIGGITILK